MNFYLCSREKELEATLRQGYWPHACDPGLRTHVQGCRDCQDLVLVAQVLQEAKSHSEEAVPLHSPGLLWWRAQLRRRNEAIQRVTEPLTFTAKIGLVGMLAALCVGVWQWNRFADWRNFFQGLSGSSVSHLAEFWRTLSGGSVWMAIVVLAGLGTLALFSGWALYLLREEA